MSNRKTIETSRKNHTTGLRDLDVILKTKEVVEGREANWINEK